MPYIITTTTLVTPADIDAHVRRCMDEGIAVADFTHVSTRRAVATLDEAVLAVRTATDLQSLAMGDIVGDQITESGGTIGPLPDGTVIQVAKISWSDLQVAASGSCRAVEGQTMAQPMLDAFNASQETS